MKIYVKLLYQYKITIINEYTIESEYPLVQGDLSINSYLTAIEKCYGLLQ